MFSECWTVFCFSSFSRKSSENLLANVSWLVTSRKLDKKKVVVENGATINSIMNEFTRGKILPSKTRYLCTE